ncbi:MAG TPA: diguanylate cyclase [Thermoanaerobaculia bacterium]
MRFVRRSAVAIALLCAALALRADERGFPLVTVFPPEVHKAGPQTFDVAQDPHGILYFGNLHGLLTYDGAWWRLIELPNDQVALSVAADAKGRVVAGLVDDFGELGAAPDGTPQFHSLLPLLPQAQRELGDVRGVCAVAGGFLFVAEQRVVFWDGKNARTAETQQRGCVSEGPTALLRGLGGVARFDPRTIRVTPLALPGKHVELLLRRADGTLIAAVRDEGLFAIRGADVTPWAPDGSQWLRGKTATGGCFLNDGRLVIASRQHGLMILERDGAIEQFIEEGAGLPDAVISEVRVDREGSLWLAMEGPIVRIDLASPVSVFDARRGLRGGVSDVVRHQGRLYVATTHGLHTIDERGFAHEIEGIREGAWRLISVDDELLLGTPKGIYRLRGDALEHLIDREGEISDFYRSRVDPSRVWIATNGGVASIHRDGGTWRWENAVSGSPEYASSVVEQDGVLWAGSVFNGVTRIDAPRTPRQRVARYGSGETNVAIAGGRIVFVRASGEIVHPDGRNAVVPDPLLGHIRAPRGFFVIAEDSRGDLWINSTPPRVFERRRDGSYTREGKPLVAVTAADIQTLRAHPNGVVWFAADKGLFRYEPTASSSALAPQPAPLIRRVVAGENRLVFGGSGEGAAVRLGYPLNRMRIEFAPASYRPGVAYQYRLDPVDSGWSEWTEQPFIDYTNLEANDYTFRLRARGPAMTPSGETSWRFTVLSPWYRTSWAYLLWAALAAIILVLIIRVRTAALRLQAERLRASVAEKTGELQHTVKLLEQANARLETLSLEDELTGIANRRFFDRALVDEWNRARRRDQPLALVLLDLDYFKDLNDRLGHQAGDDCLRRVGAFLAETIRRSGEVVARYGGEEFAILLPGVDTAGATQVAENLRSGIERLGRRITASCGVAAITPSPEGSPDQLVAAADRALYAAKHSGRNCVKVADGEETGSGRWVRGVRG